MAPFELVGIGKTFPGVVALRDVDLVLRPGTIHALVGENGAGKSTLINILSGVLAPDVGEIRQGGSRIELAGVAGARRAGIMAVHQEVDLFGDLTVLENVGLQQGLPTGPPGWVRWSDLKRLTAEALAAVGDPVSPNDLAGSLTPAQRQLVEIAAAVSRAARLLILDEPTSSLSAAEVEVLFAHLRRFRAAGAAILYVSHRFDEVFALADEVTVLRDGLRVWSGPIAETSPSQLIRHMVGREVVVSSRRPGGASGPVRLACKDLSAADGSFHGINLEVRGGEVLGVYGLVGAGRSEWAQGLCGLRPLAGGQVFLDGAPLSPTGPGAVAAAGLAYVPEDRLRQGLCRSLAVRANAVFAVLRDLATLGWVSRRREEALAGSVVRQLSVRLHSLEQPAGTLSGGNQQKIVLGRWLARDPQVLVLDEPTRGVDVGAREEIYSLLHGLADKGKAVVLISSDLPEVLAHSDRVAVFREGSVAGVLVSRTCSAEDVAAAAMPSEKYEGRPSAEQGKRGARPLLPWRELGLAVFVLIFFGLLQGVSGRFLQADSVRSLLTDAALLLFCAIGAMLVLVAGGLDISLGALMAFSAGVAGRLWEQGTPWPVALLVAVGLGAAGGALNATLALVGRVHPIVVTLGMMSVYRGLTLWWLRQDVQIDGEQRAWATDHFLGLPVVVWLGLLLLVLGWVALTRTLPGRELYAFGSNPAAAHRVGIDRARVWLLAFGAQGALAGLAGLLYLARSGGLQPVSHEDRTLEAIAAAVVGGVAITGGRGSVGGVALGCLFLVSLGPACLFLKISTHWQQTLVGSVLAVAVLLDTLVRRRSA